jgi:hypothetical protein
MGKAGELVTGSREQAALFELADGGDIGADLVMYEFKSAFDALEFGNSMVMDNMCSPSGAHKRKVGRSIIEAASEVDSSDLIADLQRARRILEDRNLEGRK